MNFDERAAVEAIERFQAGEITRLELVHQLLAIDCCGGRPLRRGRPDHAGPPRFQWLKREPSDC